MTQDQARQLPEIAVADPSPADESPQGYRLGDDFEQLRYASIMMVDDEPITMEVVQTFLEDAGYRKFILVDDSLQALAQLQEHRPDVLLLDVVMPGLSGFDILKKLRVDPEFEHLPVIILTSSSDAETKLRALDLGATDFLSKPVDPSELALRVRNTLAAKAYQDQLAFYDGLTNLPNRALFLDRAAWAIDRARRDEGRVALLHIALDQFRRITDTLGPKTGDEVVKQLAQRLLVNVRASDAMSRGGAEAEPWGNVFRLGSEDFSVLLPGIGNVANAAVVGQRVLEAMREPFDADGTDVYLTASVGIAGYPEDGDDPGTLIKRAVGASSQAQSQGGGRLQFFSSEMNRASVQRLRLEADLRRAIDNGDFRLLYQPKVRVATGEIVGVEALVRWEREGQTISPVHFVPVAEETGLIVPLGEWVLFEACRQIACWREAGVNTKVSVNISARQFFDTDLNSLVRGALIKTGVDPAHLTLEMTESLLMSHAGTALNTLRRLRSVGLEISIDDFGTGYSSLSYLKQFAVDELKIDRSFLVDALKSREDQALVTAVIYLSHELGLRVCAEGVEEQAQLDFLAKVHCDEYQGYLCSRPVTPDEVLKRLVRQDPTSS
jgi:predicted signal transduction protein with EAL and GGDEF domain